MDGEDEAGKRLSKEKMGPFPKLFPAALLVLRFSNRNAITAKPKIQVSQRAIAEWKQGIIKNARSYDH